MTSYEPNTKSIYFEELQWGKKLRKSTFTLEINISTSFYAIFGTSNCTQDITFIVIGT